MNAKNLLIALETTLPCDFILGTAERAASSNTSAARSTEGERGQISAATTPAFQLRKRAPAIHLRPDSPCYAPDACNAPCGGYNRGFGVPPHGGPSTRVLSVPWSDGSTGRHTYGAFHGSSLSSSYTAAYSGVMWP